MEREKRRDGEAEKSCTKMGGRGSCRAITTAIGDWRMVNNERQQQVTNSE
ncbi:hypothetical protein Q2T83_06315 [Fervidibacter sacchari]|uniref:Uncharacterized protein n=1 Tax=Candidatus Fervidibacter sacchari TaxID=1448929 RepID=A0ABT2ELV1_9BACT|nr:hypothetical protein [Candidatus Fervidibacter sacchari]MCS3918825.1 hypothetical protein [Candidatus Fervidibacter sacchari]WKU17429.1 hypothetical protein Q2T83_06315 [Candidatus Fervidibacter sacchari]